MPIRKYKAEQIVTLLRQIEVQMANGKVTLPLVQKCRAGQVCKGRARTLIHADTLPPNSLPTRGGLSPDMTA